MRVVRFINGGIIGLGLLGLFWLGGGMIMERWRWGQLTSMGLVGRVLVYTIIVNGMNVGMIASQQK